MDSWSRCNHVSLLSGFGQLHSDSDMRNMHSLFNFVCDCKFRMVEGADADGGEDAEAQEQEGMARKT